MPVAIRQQLQVAIAAAVSGEFSVETTWDFDNLPQCILVDNDVDTATDDDYGFTTHAMDVVIGRAAEIPEGTDANDIDALRAQCHELLAGIVTDMYADETFGDLADFIEYTGGGIEAAVGKAAMAEAQFTVTYKTVRGDPYSQEHIDPTE